MTFATTTATSTASPSSSAASDPSGHHGLSKGAIAGIVIGSVLGAALLAGLLVLLCLCLRRRSGSQHGSVLNQPSPARRGTMSQIPSSPAQNIAPQGYEVLPGGRIARMSALEGHSGDSPRRNERAAVGTAIAAGAAAGYGGSRQRQTDSPSSSSEDGESPHEEFYRGALGPPPRTSRRNGSLSSSSALGAVEDPQSPQSGSGGQVASQQSEQLPFFKDYYSQDEIHPGDKVATLWAYQPRAGDEFSLDRGDMLKVVGIWDDGWATGVLINDRAEDWEPKHNIQRDSGVSSGIGIRDDDSTPNGEIKAFPLVCVCLPEHWQKTIEGDGSTEIGSNVEPMSHGVPGG